jgi:hypothetical protein
VFILKNFNLFKINTYEKQAGGGGVLSLTRNSKSRFPTLPKRVSTPSGHWVQEGFPPPAASMTQPYRVHPPRAIKHRPLYHFTL